MRRVRGVAALVAALAVTATAHAGSARKDAIPRDHVPAWAREAAERTVGPVDAARAVLLEETVVEPLADGGVRVMRRVAARILRPSAMHEVGTFAVRYRTGDDVVSLDAWTLLPDGTARKALTGEGQEDVSDLPYVPGASVFEDSRLRAVVAPGVAVGAVVAFESEVVERLDLGAESMLFGEIDAPTALSRLVLRVPEGWGLASEGYRAESLSTERTPTSLTVTGRDLATQPAEPMPPPKSERLPEVWVRWWSPDGSRGFADWNAVARWTGGLADAALGDPGPAAETSKRLRPASPDALPAALERAFEHVARDVRYVSIQIGIGGYRPHTPASVEAAAYGDCKDKATLLRALVRPWGIDTRYVLVRTRDLGRLRKEVPTPGMFDHVVAGVVLPDGVDADLWPALDLPGVGRLLILDGTDRDGYVGSLPSMDQGADALVVGPDGGVLVTLPSRPPQDARLGRRVSLEVAGDGTVASATIVDTWEGGAAPWARERFAGLAPDERDAALARSFQDCLPGATVSDYRVEGLDRTEGPIVETVRLRGGRAGKRVSTMLILQPGRCAATIVPERLPPPPRRWDLWLSGSPATSIDEVRVTVPDGWIPEEIPGPAEIATPEIAASSAWRFENGVLTYRRESRVLETEIPSARYPAYHDAAAAIRGDASQGIVLVRR